MKDNKPEIEPFYKRQSEMFVDSLFDKGYFAEEITRKDMRNVEDLLAHLFQTQVEGAIRANEMLRKVREVKSNDTN